VPTPAPTPRFNMTLEVFWYQITSAELPFPTSRAITSLPPGNGALINSGHAEYMDPSYNGIYIVSNGLSGGNARWVIVTTAEMSGSSLPPARRAYDSADRALT